MARNGTAPAAQNAPIKPLDAFLIEEYDTADGKKKKYHQVGTAFPHRTGEGFNLVITPGMAVSGEIAIFPRKERVADGSQD